MVHGRYNSLWVSRSESVRPLARTARRVFFSPVARVCSSLRKRWTHRSQCAGMPKNPSQTAMKEAACEMALGGRVVNLHPVMVAQPPHELAHGSVEAMLMQPHEADDAALRRVGLPVQQRCDHPLGLGHRRPTSTACQAPAPPVMVSPPLTGATGRGPAPKSEPLRRR
jgi:hypothetical protein